MSCEGCQYKITETLNQIPHLKSKVNAEESTVTLDSLTPLDLEHINKQLKAIGDYQLSELPITNSNKPQDRISPSSVYYCPMECEGDKVYFSQGERCPVCKMYLVPIEDKLAQDPNYKPTYSLTQLPANFKEAKGHYFCPMFCESDKTYDSNVGCPVCGMDLEPINDALLSKASFIEEPKPPHHHEKPKITDDMAGRYYCPMYCEDDKTYDSNVGCPVCGMDLVKYPEKKVAVYKCPNHPEIVSDKPGECSICGTDLVRQDESSDDIDENEILLKRKFYTALAFTLPLFILSMGGMFIDFNINKTTKGSIEFLLTLPVLFYSGWFLMKRGWISFRTWNLNMFSLIALGVAAAFIFSLVALFFPTMLPHAITGHRGSAPLYFEAVAVIITLVILGQLMEAVAHRKTGGAIKELMQLMPSEAIVIRNGKEEKILIEEVVIGDQLLIKPGDKIPVDGKIIEGHSTLDESMITGESIPVEKSINDKIIAGTVNGNQPLKIVAENIGSDTTIAHIIKLVTDASRSKAPIQKITDKVAKIFVPAVIFISIVTFLAWIVLGDSSDKFAFGFANAIAVLIVACPCALGLATPMSLMVGIGKGAKSGVLIKNAEALEIMNQINILVTDKTGTLTEGKPTLIHTECININEINLLQIIASLSQNSEHPLSSAIINKAKDLDIKSIPSSNSQNYIGKGVSAVIENKRYALGNFELLKELNIAINSNITDKIESLQDLGHTVSIITREDEVIGFVGFKDKIKSSSITAIQNLQNQGVKVVMLSGDNERTASAIAKELGLTDFKAQCLPEDKLNFIKELQNSGHIVAMAGDGINDAPALAQANIGIAMGTGTAVAMENADITLMKGDLTGITKAKKLSNALVKNIRENLFFAFIYNVIGIPIAAGILYPYFGILMSPMIAAAAMSCSSLSVILNSLRLNKLKL